MAVSILLYCVVLSLISVESSSVPVLIWESSTSDVTNPFPATPSITSGEFSQYLMNITYADKPDPLIVLFLEESLSVEDFSKKDLQGHGCFSNLKRATENAVKVTFLPFVQDPIDATKRLSELGYDLQHMDHNNTDKLSAGCGKLFIVKMQAVKSNESRWEQLRRHDEYIYEIYSGLVSNCSRVVAILSGEHPSWAELEGGNRTKRRVVDLSNSTSIMGFIIYQDMKGVALLISSSPPTLSYKGKDVILGADSGGTEITGDIIKPYITLTIKYSTGHQLIFNFDNKTSGYWSLKTMNVIIGAINESQGKEFVLKPSMTIEAPMDWSYHTGHQLRFTSKTVTVTFKNLQVQPFFRNPGSKAFGEAVDAVPFMTAPIWSGIIVIFILGIITSWGIYMIMNIRVMDRFEDPKGKTISVTPIDN